MRRAFSDALLNIARADDRLIFLTGDMGFQVFDEFCREFPERYVNVGIAEAQLVDCAAGLALAGWKPVVYSIASFMTGRAFEQIRIAVGTHKLGVVIVGAGGGYTYAASGTTHHAKEDMALMSLIPDMAVVAPGDPSEIHALLPQMVNRGAPCYLRVGRFGEPTIDSDAPIELGKARILRDGKDIAVLTTGDSAVPALEAAERLEEDGHSVMVCHFHTLMPFDRATLDEISSRVREFIVVEDHGLQGGLFAAIAQWRVTLGAGLKIHRLGPSDELIIGNPKQSALRRRFQYDSEGIAGKCLELLR